MILIGCKTTEINSQVKEDGAWTSGGDWGHAKNVLHFSKEALSSFIKTLHQAELSNFIDKVPAPAKEDIGRVFISPDQVSPEYLGSIIENVHLSLDKKNNKIFDWGKDEHGTVYIEALDKFHGQFGAFWPQHLDDNQKVFLPYVQEVMKRLVKEAAHTWGYNDAQGSSLGNRLVMELNSRVNTGKFQASVHPLEMGTEELEENQYLINGLSTLNLNMLRLMIYIQAYGPKDGSLALDFTIHRYSTAQIFENTESYLEDTSHFFYGLAGTFLALGVSFDSLAVSEATSGIGKALMLKEGTAAFSGSALGSLAIALAITLSDYYDAYEESGRRNQELEEKKAIEVQKFQIKARKEISRRLDVYAKLFNISPVEQNLVREKILQSITIKILRKEPIELDMGAFMAEQGVIPADVFQSYLKLTDDIHNAKQAFKKEKIPGFDFKNRSHAQYILDTCKRVEALIYKLLAEGKIEENSALNHMLIKSEQARQQASRWFKINDSLNQSRTH